MAEPPTSIHSAFLRFRLRLLSKDSEHVTTPPRTDSLLQLLLQGLHNRDQKILNSVLDRADEDLIDKTVRKLPVEGVVPLIEELHNFIRVSSICSSIFIDIDLTVLNLIQKFYGVFFRV